MQDSFFLESDFDGKRLSVMTVCPETPRFCLQITHGMAEHKRRYIPFMEYIASIGGACIISDMRGHGETSAPADYGYFGENGVEATLSDLHQIGSVLREKYPGLPMILLGHSMGSLVARSYAAEHDEMLAALILSGEASNNPAVGAGLLLTRLMALFRGGRHLSPLIEGMSTGAYDKAFPAGEKFQWLSANEENRRKYMEDPGCGFPFTLNGYETLFSFMKRTYSPKYYNVRNKNLPILFLSGEEDPVMGGKKAFDDAVRFMRDMGYRDVRSKLYPGMRHEILMENDRETVCTDIAAFIEETVQGSAEAAQ
ncbi:MAG: alpha/beta fold hydrolase [Clostridia bacterium]|nr:alpha/beta fold hydrolase [Clostridia bacterium]